MTEELATALRAMVDSEPPRALDVGGIMAEGRRGRARQRTAVLGGGTAVLAATGLAVGVLAPFGHHQPPTTAAPALSTTHPGPTAPGRIPSSAPGNSTPTHPAHSTASSSAQSAPVDPHDPIVTHWQFGYLPDGMTAPGGAGARGDDYSTTWAYESSGFGMRLERSSAEPRVQSGEHLPTEKVPAEVAGAVKAFWFGYGGGQIVAPGNFPQLAWQLPAGQWLTITATGIAGRTDWKEQVLEAAAHVLHQDRAVPSPIRLAGGVPEGLDAKALSVTFIDGNPGAEMDFWASGDQSGAATYIVAFKGPASEIGQWVPPKNANTCEASNGLTVCVSTPVPTPEAVTALGGPKELLKRVTSLGPDPANWTTDVFS